MAESKLKRLQKALAKGDLEGAKKLADEIEATKPPRKRPAAKKAAKADEVPETRPGARQGPSLPSGAPAVVLPGDIRHSLPQTGQDRQPVADSSWMAPSRGNGERVEARKVSMEGRRHINEFDGWLQGQGKGVDQMDAKARKVEKVIAKASSVPRPGQHGSMRQPAQKIHTNCDGCGRPFDIYPSELTQTYEDNGRPYAIYKCERCIRRGR